MLESKKSDEFDGTVRTLYRFDCKCTNTVWLPTAHLKGRKYCTRECPIKTKSEYECATCKKIIYRASTKVNRVSRSGLVFCGRICKEQAQSLAGGLKAIQPGHYGLANGKYSYREWALKHYGSQCQRCSYNEFQQMLDVHHKDSDRNNNKLENLEVLCVWCHALVTRNLVGN